MAGFIAFADPPKPSTAAALPLDHVHESEMLKPRRWDIARIRRFMSWSVQSMATQVLVPRTEGPRKANSSRFPDRPGRGP